MAKWIFCAGAKRSGSTLQYNIVSSIVEYKGLGERISHFKPEDFSEVSESFTHKDGILVCKVHLLTPEIEAFIHTNSSFVLYCFRDVRDVIVSMINQEWLKDRQMSKLQVSAEKYVESFEQWNNAGFNMYRNNYETFYQNYYQEIERIASWLKIDLSADEVTDIEISIQRKNISSTNAPANPNNDGNQLKQFDPRTLLHEGHIQGLHPGQYLKDLTEEEIISIEAVAYKWLIENGYSLNWQKGSRFLSLSQHGDDFIAWSLTGKATKGTIIEIGAYDGVHLSNGFSLEQLGWRAVNVEANPYSYELLIKNRPKSCNIFAAVTGKEEGDSIQFYTEPLGVLSGANVDVEDIKRRYEKRGLQIQEPTKVIVPTILPEDLLNGVERSTMPMIVSIDVEGSEMSILSAWNFKEICPDLFIIEANSSEHRHEICALFSESFSEYKLVGSNYQNLFFGKGEAIQMPNVDFGSLVQAKQFHALGGDFAIQAIRPNWQFIDNAKIRKSIFHRILGRLGKK